MNRDLDAAIAFLFPSKVEQIRAQLLPLPSDRVRWAVLACSRGDEAEFNQYLAFALRDWRDVLRSESMSDDPKGALLRILPRPEELAFRLHTRDLERLAFFDRVVWSGAVAFDPPKEPGAVVRALAERMAPHYGPATWTEPPLERARFLLLGSSPPWQRLRSPCVLSPARERRSQHPACPADGGPPPSRDWCSCRRAV